MVAYQKGDKYYYITDLQSIRMRKWREAPRDYNLQRAYNCFETRNAAEMVLYQIIPLLKSFNK